MQSYPQISEHRALYELPMNRGFAFIAAADARNPLLELASLGYIAQELDRLTPS